MSTLISLGLSLLLAWPTYGISLIVFFLLFFALDNRSVDSLLAATVTAMREEVSEEVYGINESTIRKIFARYAVQPPHVTRLGHAGASMYWGIVRHPLVNAGQIFSVRFSYIPLPGGRRFVNVKAAPGVDATVLSADDILKLIESLSLMPLDGRHDLNDGPGRHHVAAVSHESGARAPRDVTVDTIKPKSDDDIRNLMIRAAGLPDGHLKCPKLSFAVLRQFLIKQNVAVEYLPHHGGGRFSIEIGEFSYAASATTLNPSAKDESGIILWAKIDGYASSRNATLG